MVNGAQFFQHSPLILNAHDNMRVQQIGYWHWVEEVVQTRWSRWRGQVKWHPRGVVFAEIRHAQWTVICPVKGCGGAILTAPGLRFFCVECLNITNDGYAYEVLFPEQIERIESILSLRPATANRNWLCHESVDNLIAENIANGLPGS